MSFDFLFFMHILFTSFVNSRIKCNFMKQKKLFVEATILILFF